MNERKEYKTIDRKQVLDGSGSIYTLSVPADVRLTISKCDKHGHVIDQIEILDPSLWASPKELPWRVQ